MRYLLFWDVTHRRLVVSYRRFGTTYGSYVQGPSCQESSCWTLRNISGGNSLSTSQTLRLLRIHGIICINKMVGFLDYKIRY